eukprot:CAMPEP_0202891642 /NCGR_PEP_ID=MMETSP1392-20130828/1651_1 /ASSEMBLY_ACC=CAM_ASM_000868 /TAXON_ID=225041 /ORGANISM="Chlamydomonas chlamydogama, Strain SAG 11-48b" /LENGTH=274 /DNA_ID=CAMNT_0049575457 /DNA_START=162 /DNA_END=986 /DNA_ORIENTATION=+
MTNFVKLNNGVQLPLIGLGVYKSTPGNETYDAVISALKLGYRHIDTAQMYQNEVDVGKAVRDSGVPRSEIFVTTKLWRSEWGHQRATSAIQASLQRLGLEYVDLLLLHCPGDAATRAETWRALEEAVTKGLIRSIGVSNFGVAHLEKLLSTAQIPPAVNQIELHPFLQWREVVGYCKEKGIVLEAYSPLVKSQKLQEPVLASMAERYQVTPAQLLIRWSLQSGFVPLPKSVNPKRQAENLDVFGFSLSDADMQTLDGLEQDLVTGWDPIRNDPV